LVKEIEKHLAKAHGYDPTNLFLDLGLEVRISRHLDTNNFMREFCSDSCLCTCDKVKVKI
jgi:hypothetical protein